MNFNDTEFSRFLDSTIEAKINTIVSRKLKEFNAITGWVGIITQVNPDGTANVELPGDSIELRNRLNKSGTTLEVGDEIYLHSAGSLTSSYIAINKLKTPSGGGGTGAVSSVNTRTGDVVLSASDVGLENVTNESKSTMFTSPTFTGIPTSPTADGLVPSQIVNVEFLEYSIIKEINENGKKCYGIMEGLEGLELLGFNESFMGVPVALPPIGERAVLLFSPMNPVFQGNETANCSLSSEGVAFKTVGINDTSGNLIMYPPLQGDHAGVICVATSIDIAGQRSFIIDKIINGSVYNTKANIDSPTFQGTPQAPTVDSADDSDKIATTSFVQSVVSENEYVHPTGDGNLHVPATGTTNNGKFLKAGSTAGSISWQLLTKADVGLSNVDNTSDLDKPVSNETQVAIDDLSLIIGDKADYETSVQSITIREIIALTQAEYTAISPKDGQTLYIITD